MGKKQTRYVCQECGAFSPQWLGKCPMCGKFGSLIEEILEEENINNNVKVEKVKPTPLNEIQNEWYKRVSSGIKELDTVLGGGIVPQSIILIGGDPGIGKSTILTQVSGYIAKSDKVLYVSAEESLSQTKLRCNRLNIHEDYLHVLNECRLESIEEASKDYNFIVIDSIQAIYLSSLSSSAGSVGQVRECASRLQRLAKSQHKTIFIIGHVTKDGTIAGPKVLEHIMDTVLYFEGEPSDKTKLLRAVKNRFGSAQEVGIFEMKSDGIYGVKDYNGIFMSENRGMSAGSIVTPSMSGNRCMPVEIQSLVTKTIFGMPRRMPVGIDCNKLILNIAVLERKVFIPFISQDVYVNAMGGIKISEPSVDLPLALSLVSASKNETIDKTITAFGEIGLTGEIRGVSNSEKRIVDMIRLGFKTIIIPKHNYDKSKTYDGIKIVPVSYLSEAIKYVFPK